MTFGEFLWSFLVLYCLFFYFVILFRIIDDLFRDPARTGMAKTGWVLFLLFLPVIAMVVYLISNGADMASRAMKQASDREQQQREYIREVARDEMARTAAPAATVAPASGAAQDVPSQSQEPSRSPSTPR